MDGREVPLPGMGDDRRGYRGPEVAAMVGVTYRKLDHWTSQGLVASSIQDADGPGTHRLYSADDVLRVAVINRLREGRLSLDQITNVLAVVDQMGAALEALTVVIDGDEVHVCSRPEQVLRLIGTGRAVTVLALAPVTMATREALALG